MNQFYAFHTETNTRRRRCSECRKWIFADNDMLASRRRPSGSLIKVVCSEDCRLEFEDRLFQALADRRLLGLNASEAS